jgi:hypothetical protein
MEHSGHANSVDSWYKKHFDTKKSKTNSALIGRKTAAATKTEQPVVQDQIICTVQMAKTNWILPS